jgi:Carboxypeptidase regulatory-like domain/TonB dependent receptor/TonB-dependent Receptor Plug Domain
MQIRYFLAAGVAALSIASLAPTPVHAQQITTGIEGTVTDEAGVPISGAEVTVTDTRTGATRTTTTTASGGFNTSSLVTGGPYTVSVSANGFEGQTIEGIQTSLQGNSNLSFTLTSGAGEIVVTGSRVQVTQLAVGPGTSFTAVVLENAPTFNRDIRDIIRLDPRVSLDRDDGGSGQDRISCLGGNDRGNAFTVDGISQGDIFGLNNTGFSSRSSTPMPYAAIRETQVQFAPFDVDYGQFTGCAINAVTKSGTNDYKFGGFFEYADDGIRGNSVAGRPVAAVKPEKRWGAYLGGPIIKDRLFVYGAYEHQEAGQSQDEGPSGAGYSTEMPGVSKAQFDAIREVLNRVYKIDTGDLVFSRPFKNDRYFVRADLQITDDHRLEATYQRLEESTMRADDLATTGLFANTAVGRNTFLLSGTKSNYYSGRLYSQWSDQFSTELRYSRSEVQDIQDPVGGGEAQSDNPIPRIVVGVDNPTGPDGTVSAGPGFSRAANDLKTDLDQFRAVAKLDAGDHQIKFGAELNRANLFNLFVQNATGTLTFRNIADLEAGLLSPGTGNNNVTSSAANTVGGQVEGAFGNFSATGDIRDAAAAFRRDIWSIFAQDDWQINDSLSAVIGVRADWYNGGRPKLNPNFVTRYGFGNDTSFSNIAPTIMPRVALSYDAGDFAVFNRAQIKGGVGIFSGGDPVVWFANAFQNDGRGFALGTTQDSSCPTGQIDVVVGGTFTGVPSCFRNAASATAAAGRGRTQSIDPNIKMPTVLRANIGFSSELNFAESGFFSGWNFNLDYIYSKYRNPFNIIDLSQIPDFRTGLSGFSIDGRPIYAAIDPSITGCTARLTGYDPRPTYSNVNNICFTSNRDDELMLTNAGGYRSQIASFILSKQFDGGLFTSGGSVFFSLGYAYTDAQDRRNMYSSTAGSNYDDVSAFDRQNPPASRGFFGSKHNLSVQTNFKEEFFGEYATRLGATFIARSGRPYSLTFSGSAVYNDNASGADNVLVYLPTGITDPNISPTSNAVAVQQLLDFANGLGCAKKYIGKSVPRNTCTGDTYYDMDLSFSQELPGPGHLFGKKDKIRLYATMDNFLNFLDSGSNVQRRRDFAGRQDIANSTGVDAAGRYIITGFTGNTFDADNQINFSSSVWRMKIGISYDF